MSTTIMGIPPEETRAFKTDIDYRLQTERAMEDALGRQDVDEVILTFTEEPGTGSGVASNPGVDEFLQGLGIDEERIAYVLSFEDTKAQGKLANELRKNRSLTIDQLHELGEALKPKELSADEIAMYGLVENEPGLKNWVGREIRLLRNQEGEDWLDKNGLILLDELMSIKDWYRDSGRPAMDRRSWADAYAEAREWEKEKASEGSGMRYQTTDPRNVLYRDPETGFTVQNVKSANDLKVEGNLMQHCVGGYGYAERVKKGETLILSLRDQRNKPHATIEVSLAGIVQIKGKQNAAPKNEYKEILKRFFVLNNRDGEKYHWVKRPVPSGGWKTWSNYANQFTFAAIGLAIGMDKWKPFERMPFLNDHEIFLIATEYAKNIVAAIEHTKRYSRKKKKSESPSDWRELRYERPVVGLLIKRSQEDSYGLTIPYNLKVKTDLDASVLAEHMSGVLSTRSVNPEIRSAVDHLAKVLAQVDKLERENYQTWRGDLEAYVRIRKDAIRVIREIGSYKWNREQHRIPGEIKWLPPYLFGDYDRAVEYIENEIRNAQQLLNSTPHSSVSDDIEEVVKESPEKVDGLTAFSYLLVRLYENINGHPINVELPRTVSENPSYYHGTHRPWTVYNLAQIGETTGRFIASSEFNKLGLWLTDQPGHARFYGDQIIKFDLEVKKPFTIKRQGAYQPFAEGLYFKDIAKSTIPIEDRMVIEECLSGHRALWDDPKTIALFVKASEEGAWGFGSGKHNRERYKRVRNEMLLRDVWEKAYRDWLQNAPYWKAVRDMLVASGYDAVVFEDSTIDLGKDDPHHTVIVYLQPEKLEGSPMTSGDI